MIPASRSIGPVREASRPMPWVQELVPLYEQGVTFREGQLMMIAGYPGSGKSLFAQWLCDKWGVPTMYVSMDMSQSDAVTRLGAIRTGLTTDKVKQAFEDDGAESAWIEEQLEGSLMDFVIDDSPSLEELVKQLCAYEEMYGHLPNTLVLDNLVDLEHDGDDEYRAWNQTLLWLKSLCRMTMMTVVVIHHARELDKTDWPAARRDLAGKVSRTPELTLSVALTPGDRFRIAVVKNRTGKQSAMAQSGVEYLSQPAKASFRPLGLWAKPVKGES